MLKVVTTYWGRIKINVTFSSVEFGSLTTSQLMEKVRGLQNLAFQLGLDEGMLIVQMFESNKENAAIFNTTLGFYHT